MPGEKIIKDLTKISESFRALILRQIEQKNLTRIELARLVAQIDFFKDLGLENQIKLKLKDLFDDYDEQIKEILKFAETEKVRNALTVNRDLLEAYKIFKANELLGKAGGYAAQVQSQIFDSIITGKPFSEIKAELSNVPLTSPQLNASLSTGFSNYSRSITALTYQDDKNKRFLYYGSIIPTSSKQCTWLLMNQNMKGYTKKEIDKGIDTPFGIIFWNGRVPNFNCDDKWYPVTDLLIETMKDFQKRNKELAETVLQGKKK